MQIISPDFQHNQPIPSKFTCQGQDINPLIKFANVSKEAKSLVLIFDDPDAPAGSASPGWVHWLVYNIKPSVSSITENSVPSGASQGINDWGRNDYGGPCPPSGTHRYIFTLYAIDIMTNFPNGLNKSELISKIRNHTIDQATLIGLVSH